MATTVAVEERPARPDTATPPADTASRRPSLHRRLLRAERAPLLLVAVAVAFGLWELRAETLAVHNLNDSAVHVSMIRWAQHRVADGSLPLDGWFPYLQLGFAQFHHYQSLPHILTGGLATVLGADRSLTWTLYLLLATWPIAVYISARLFGLDRWTAGAAALVSPLVSSVTLYGYEHGSYTWRGLGVWSQLWGMWLLPLAWGLSWRAVNRGRHYAVAALAVGLTVACHFLTGYVGLLSLGVWVIVVPKQLWRHLARAAAIGVGGVLAASWVIVPLLLDSKWASQSEFLRGRFWMDSYGARQELGWFISGHLFDEGRWPVLTVLVAIGFVVSAFRARHDERYRALVGVTVLALVLWAGRPTFGPLVAVLPGARDLLLHRFILGVHLAGILLAGVGAAALGRALARAVAARSWRLAPVVRTAVVALGVVALLPAWTERHAYDSRGAVLIRQQEFQEQTDGVGLEDLVDRIAATGGGRVYAGMANNWGAHYRIGSVPVYAWLLTRDVEAIGFNLRTLSLSGDVEVRFDETNPAHYDLFNVRYLLLPSDRRPPVDADFVAAAGRHRLWAVRTSGFLQAVDVAGAISADRRDLGQRVDPFLRSSLPAAGQLPAIEFDGGHVAPSTVVPGVERDAPGRVTSQFSDPEDGRFGGRVDMRREGAVVLKATYHPRWHVEVDGHPVDTEMLAPSFVGVRVPEGTHTVSFRYQPFPAYPLLLLIGLVALVALAVLPRVGRRRDSPHQKGQPTS